MKLTESISAKNSVSGKICVPSIFFVAFLLLYRIAAQDATDLGSNSKNTYSRFLFSDHVFSGCETIALCIIIIAVSKDEFCLLGGMSPAGKSKPDWKFVFGRTHYAKKD